MAEAVVSFVVEAIGNMLIAEGSFLSGVSDQVEQLQLDLNRMVSFLRDAAARRNDEEIITEWVLQTEELAFEAEDLIETFAFKVEARRREGIRKIPQRCICILNECYTNHRVGSEIEKLKAKISDLNRSFQDYGLRSLMERDGSSSWERQLRRTYSHIVEDDFVGLVNDVEELVKHLVEEKEIRVVSVYGMGGLGKSTLARKVYNHPKVKRHFNACAWVCISQQWQKKNILQGILISLAREKREDIEKMRDEELVRQIFQIQQSRKCLVVLDDIWSIDAWESIKHAFPKKNNGNKILLTTRNRDVALQIGPNGFHHKPRLLNRQESWELLQKKVAWYGHDQLDSRDVQKMEKLGKEMVTHCGGLPLAAVVLGGILATKPSADDWDVVCKNIKAYLGRGDNLGQHQGELQKILALSYNDLPYKLKPCFLYLGKYSEDSNIDVETLYEMWIAEGMVSVKDQRGEESMLEVAERYLGELVKRCMVQVEAQPLPTFTKFKSFFLHDLMRDLCLSKAAEENFFMFVDHHVGLVDSLANHSSTGKIHRLFSHLHAVDIPKYDLPGRRLAKNLRSLTISVSGKYEGRLPGIIMSQFNKFKKLRVLSIEGLSPGYMYGIKNSICITLDHVKLPAAIGNLIHLRYLSLRNSSFWWLTSSLGNLQHLQTLDLRAADVLRIPDVLWKMRELRYLYLPHQNFNYPLSKLRLESLSKLEILENFCTKLCHAKGLSKLSNLRALTASAHKDLQDLSEIIQYISNSSLRRASLEIWGYDSIISEEAPTLLRQLLFCSNLHILRVRVPIGNLPKYDAKFSSGLVELLLQRSQMEEDPMETLEKLPNLQKLILFHDSFLGKEMHCHSMGFSQLRFLQLARLPNLEKWKIDQGAMPNLSRLIISSCLKLEMIPDGLRFIKMLNELEIKRMPREFNDRVQVIDGQEGEDFYKVCSVHSVVVS